MTDEFRWLDATAQAELVRRGRRDRPTSWWTPRSRGSRPLNPALNAVITPLYDKARAVADGFAEPRPTGRSAGVPFLLKDAVAHSAGDPYHCGMQVLKDAGWVAPRRHLAREAATARPGFVILGKTNLPELAMSVTTEPLAYGATHNPWNLDHSTGGSSGGSGAAVAAGMVAVAHGNDMGGSIRIPASECGLVGLKPTRARNTLGPDFAEYWGLTTHEHVLTRCVRDTAAVLDATSGSGRRRSVRRAHARRGRSSRGRRRPGSAAYRAPDPTSRAATTKFTPTASPRCAEAARLLESLGHHVETVDIPALDDPSLTEAIASIFSVFVARDLDRWSAASGRDIAPSELDPWNEVMAETGRTISASQYLAALEAANTYSADSHSGGPTAGTSSSLPSSPTRHLVWVWSRQPRPSRRRTRRSAHWRRFTFPFNMTGQPAVSLPLHWNDSGPADRRAVRRGVRPRGRAAPSGGPTRDGAFRGPTVTPSSRRSRTPAPTA